MIWRSKRESISIEALPRINTVSPCVRTSIKLSCTLDSTRTRCFFLKILNTIGGGSEEGRSLFD